MEETLRMYKSTVVPPGNKPIDPRSDPKYFDYTWTNWLDIIDPKTEEEIRHEEEEQDNINRPTRSMTDYDLQLKLGLM